jgi:ribosomal protein S18 acetylase RimI-like enzyme
MTALDDPGSLQLAFTVAVRQAEKDDVKKLEWHGQFRHFRNLIRRAYQEQRKGRRLMLVVDFNGFPIAQIFVQFTANNRRIADGQTRAYLYSFRVMDLFQRQGIGTYLMHQAEHELIQRGFLYATIAVAKDNEGAQRLYSRLGYHVIGDDPGKWHYIDHRGMTQYVNEPCWVLEKRLEIP